MKSVCLVEWRLNGKNPAGPQFSGGINRHDMKMYFAISHKYSTVAQRKFIAVK